MYPIMVDLSKKKLVVVGGGKIALRKTNALLQAGGSPLVIAPHFDDEFEHLEDVQCIKQTYSRALVKEAHMIFACTDSHPVNQQIVDEAQDWQWVNDCSEKSNSDFFSMATIEQELGLIALSSYGRSPADTKEAKQRLLQLLDNQAIF